MTHPKHPPDWVVDEKNNHWRRGRGRQRELYRPVNYGCMMASIIPAMLAVMRQRTCSTRRMR